MSDDLPSDTPLPPPGESPLAPLLDSGENEEANMADDQPSGPPNQPPLPAPLIVNPPPPSEPPLQNSTEHEASSSSSQVLQAPASALQQSVEEFSVDDRVSVDYRDGMPYAATIIEKSDGQYKVVFDCDRSWMWVEAPALTRIEASASVDKTATRSAAKDSEASQLAASALGELIDQASIEELAERLCSMDPKQRCIIERLCDETLASPSQDIERRADMIAPAAEEQALVLMPETSVSAEPAAIERGPPMPPPEVLLSVGAPPLPQQWQAPATLAVLNNAPAPVQRPQALTTFQKIQRCDPKRQIWAWCRGLPSLYCKSLAQRPWAFLLLYCVIIAAVVSAGWRPVEVNTDIEAFSRVEGNESKYHAVYRKALKHQKAAKNHSSLADRVTFELEMFYQAKEGSVFSEAPLRDIKAFENQLRGQAGWSTMCDMSDAAARFRCQPGESMANYAWPVREDLQANAYTPFTLDFNGESRERLPKDAFLTYLREGQAGPHDLRKFLPHEFSGIESDATLLRSIFAFTAPSQDATAFREAYENFVAEDLFLFLREQQEKTEEEADTEWQEPSSIRIYFRGKEIEDHEVRYYLAGDIKLTIGCLVFIFLFLWFQLRSLLLACAGLAQVSLVPLIAYALIPLDKLSLSSFACIFLVMGLVSNDLPAAKEYWRRVGKETEHKYPISQPGWAAHNDELVEYYKDRVSLLFPALLLRLWPQFMVSLSFLVFLGTTIKPIREFGLFMSVSVTISSLVTLSILPALLILHEDCICPLVHQKLPRPLAIALEPKNLPFPWRPLTRLLLKAAKPRIGQWIWLGTGIVTLILFIITVVVASNKDDNPGVPEVYSSSHYGVAGRPLVDAFLPTAPAAQPAPPGTRVCEMETGLTACGLHWCEAPQATDTTSTTTAPNANNECVCQSSRLSFPSSSCVYVNVTGKLAGHSFATAAMADRLTAWKNYLVSAIPQADGASLTLSDSRRLSSLVLEHWESGATDVEPVTEMPWSLIARGAPSSQPYAGNTCSYSANCYCGPRVCAKPSTYWDEQAKVTFTPASNRLLSVPTPSAREVNVVFGIIVEEHENFFRDDTVEWKLDDKFEPASPWIQRMLLSMCTNIPSSLNVLEKHCWIEDFRSWLQGRGEKFPTARFGDFQAQLKQFLAENSHVPITAMWTNSAENMVATAFGFLVPPKTAVSDIVAEVDAWKNYVDSQNAASREAVSPAWATSNDWPVAIAEDEAMANSWILMLVAYLAVIFAGLLYTWDLAFTLIAVGIATLALTVLSFFTFCLFGWAAGPWEVVLMVVFLHHFTEPAFRVGRGAVWANVLVTEMRIAGHIPTPASERKAKAWPQLQALPPPEMPAQIADAESPAPIATSDPTSLAVLNPQEPVFLARSSTLGSDNTSEHDEEVVDTGRIAFEGRLHRFTLNIANACFASALKLIFCAFFLLFCEFRLFSRLGVVTLLVEIILLPCTFLLLPSAILLCPTREEPDAIVLFRYAKQEFTKWRQEDH